MWPEWTRKETPHQLFLGSDSGRPDPDQGPEPRDVPETPPDEPKPTPVQDPPAEPDPPPYVVHPRRDLRRTNDEPR
jgi:hypothetical protein